MHQSANIYKKKNSYEFKTLNLSGWTEDAYYQTELTYESYKGNHWNEQEQK